MAFSFITETDLLTRLMFAQNHPANLNRDVMTFAGFCDDRAELLRHVQSCEATVADYEAARVSS